MTKFNPENKETLNYGETLGTAMGITDQNDATQYLFNYVQWLGEKMKIPHDEAMKVAKGNISYYCGYYSGETQARMNKLFSLS